MSKKASSDMTALLFHDGCGLCLALASQFAALRGSEIDIVNLGLDKTRIPEAVALGVTRLPSLVIDGQVMRLEDHSAIEHLG
jgi:hypothetical protein